MATLTIGEGIQMEVSVPKTTPLHLDSTTAIQKGDTLIKRLINEIAIVEEKVNDNQESILDAIDLIDTELKKDVLKIQRPEVKTITVHKDHKKDIEDLYSFVLHHKDDAIEKLKLIIKQKEIDAENKKIKIYIAFSIGIAISILLHLL